MKHNILIAALLLPALFCRAQEKDVFALRITGQVEKINDTTVIVQVEQTNGVTGLQQKQYGLLKGNYSNGDTSTVGSGKCNGFEGYYYYFTINLWDRYRMPRKGDLLYTMALYPTQYKGQIYKLIQHDISLRRVNGDAFHTYAFSVFGDKYQEESVIDSMVADIKYTAVEMETQDPSQNMMIGSGRYKDKKLFTAMKESTANDITDFIDYVIARPAIYAGNEWKVSETYATWLIRGAPTVIKQ